VLPVANTHEAFYILLKSPAMFATYKQKMIIQNIKWLFPEMVCSKKKISKLAVIRNKVRRRFFAAMVQVCKDDGGEIKIIRKAAYSKVSNAIKIVIVFNKAIIDLSFEEQKLQAKQILQNLQLQYNASKKT
jgi:hypothetical protein